MVKWKLVYTSQARRDAKKIATAELKGKVIFLLKILEQDPLQTPPPFEKLIGDLEGADSRRINIQHRLVYQILDKKKSLKLFGCGHIMSEHNFINVLTFCSK